jgi:hypothetical protein
MWILPFNKKNMKKLLLLLTLCSISFLACKKQREDVPALEPLVDYSIDAFLQKTGFNQAVSDFDPGAGFIFERGIEFETKVDVNLNTVYIKFPASATNLKIILWDGGTMQPINSFTINTYNAGLGASLSVNPVIALQKNKKYCLSYATNTAVFKRKRTDGSAVNYPIEFSNLKILSHTEKSLTNINLRQYPTSIVNASFYGNLSFTFQ